MNWFIEYLIVVFIVLAAAQFAVLEWVVPYLEQGRFLT